jgi:hypothetical protein
VARPLDGACYTHGIMADDLGTQVLFGPAQTVARTRPLPPGLGASIPGAPDLKKPVRHEPVQGVDLATYARVAAGIAEQRRPQDEVLREAGIDEGDWIDAERTWLLRIAASLLQGDVALIEQYEQLYIEAQDALGPPGPSRPFEDYARIMAQIQRGAPAARVLQAEGLSLADWARLHRSWSKRAAQDPHLAALLADLSR